MAEKDLFKNEVILLGRNEDSLFLFIVVVYFKCQKVKMTFEEIHDTIQ